MRRVIAALVVSVGVYGGAAGCCLLFGLLLSMARQSLVDEPPLSKATLTGRVDRIVIMDWDAGLTYYARTTAGSGCAPAVAERVAPEVLQNLKIEYDQPLHAQHRSIYLRDIATGELHPPSGAWYWTVNDGVESGSEGSKKYINVRFSDPVR